MTISITKPTVGGSENTWGTTVNTALDDVVAVLNGTTASTPDLTVGSWKVGGTAITADAAEINKLDGVLATTAELNYTDGVTSNIQTQLNRRLELISETVLSSSAADVTFTLPTGYRDFQLILNNVKSSGNTAVLYIEASTDGGSTFDATANYSSLNVRHLETAGGSESTSMNRSTTGINVATNNVSDQTVVIGGTTYNFPTVGASGVVNISNPLNASEFTAFSGVIVNAVVGTGTGDDSGETQVQTFGGVYGLQAAVNAINLSHKTGASVAAGAVVALYGMKDY